MLRRTGYKITKRGKIIKQNTEHYLRDDIWCGSQLCEECNHVDPILDSEVPYYLIPDLDVVLHQMDFLKHYQTRNVIILQTILNMLRDENGFEYHRLRDLIKDQDKKFYVFSNEHHRASHVTRNPNETVRDRNMRSIRSATKWYSQHLLGQIPVYFVTNNIGTKQIALDDHVNAKTLDELIKSTGKSDLYDLVAVPTIEDGDINENEWLFPKHLTKAEITESLNEKTVKKGVFFKSRENYSEGNVKIPNLDYDILISGYQDINRALNGDEVVVQILPEEQWKSSSQFFADPDDPDLEKEVDNSEEGEKVPTGKIVGIIERRSFRRYCGVVDPDTISEDNVLFEPMQPELPKFSIRSGQLENLINKKIVVSLDTWPINSEYPLGHFIKILGDVGDVEVESEALLIQHNISYEEFSDDVKACLPPEDWHVKPEDLHYRKDIRHLRVFSIDPPGCTDIDDTLHVRKLENGNYELGVHIADVTHFVEEGAAIDREARSRGNTVYLVSRRIDMLPQELSTDICSLKSGVDRFAFSVFWELTPQADIVNTSFAKTIIRSVEEHTYAQAQTKIDDPERNDPITQDLRTLNTMAKILRKKRIEKGALSLSSPAVKFKREEENQDPVDVELYELRETNSLVEEFMLLANVSVAKQIHKTFPAFSLLRRHPPPDGKKFQALIDLVNRKGIELNIDTSKSLADSLDQANLENDPYFNELLRILSTRCMQQAVYFSSGSLNQSEYHHYGLASEFYTHFTSPIRRYADVIVHRLLAASISAAALPRTITPTNVERTCNIINRRHRMAEIASRDSTRLHTLMFFKNNSVLETARVLMIKRNGFSVLVPRYGIEGTIYLKKNGELIPGFEYDPQNHELEHDSGYKISIFDTVKVFVMVDSSKIANPKIVYMCVDPPIHDIPKICSKVKESKKEESKNIFNKRNRGKNGNNGGKKKNKKRRVK
eukprot:TRINITY_DN1605_c0_g1_i1.p1 TRINITY_DN1605_c0_g1~~TRINITY_DN1605_c0_g1_i1.p1  ORF type:complete len:947 (+),score=208.29 TRINITY_DN1605_c0_g1_i1:29-2869(+)